MTTVFLAAADEGGGAALDQVIGMSVVAAIVSAALVWIGYLHRQRRITWLQNLADYAGRKFKRPPWVALPMSLFIATLICALFGFIWDVSLHIGKGRDPGPLANPAHYFILFGLFLHVRRRVPGGGAAVRKTGPAAVRITRNWYAPVGGVLMAGCGLYALTGFPLDDVWHRIFGQDVTLWGPTHLMMIGGAGFATLSALILEYEGRRAGGEDAPEDGIWLKFVQYLGFGGVLVGLSVYQIEFDFGVAAIPSGVPADADRRRSGVRVGGRAHDAGTWRSAHRGRAGHRTARRRGADRRPGARLTDQLVRALPRSGTRRRDSWPSLQSSSGPSCSASSAGSAPAPSGSGWSPCGWTACITSRGPPACGRRRSPWRCPSPCSPARAAPCSAWCSPTSGCHAGPSGSASSRSPYWPSAARRPTACGTRYRRTPRRRLR